MCDEKNRRNVSPVTNLFSEVERQKLEVYECFQMDIMVAKVNEQTKSNYLVLIDVKSRMAFTAPMEATDTTTVMEILIELFVRI